MSSKGCSSESTDFELFAKIKRPGFYTLTETRFIKQNKNPELPFVDSGK